ncbi:hypothetical protein B0T10DRAFT_559786 [Thelonectria olida]|uniref:Uncharacterized protein n=1 Tax=Thelonectria olida TaxID=1576542 RepID=A0A9P8WAX4_9HYPO|nr:hypothetical protein B0T10DRAFT_559786 [Thelonectria olida]
MAPAPGFPALTDPTLSQDETDQAALVRIRSTWNEWSAGWSDEIRETILDKLKFVRANQTNRQTPSRHRLHREPNWNFGLWVLMVGIYGEDKLKCMKKILRDKHLNIDFNSMSGASDGQEAVNHQSQSPSGNGEGNVSQAPDISSKEPTTTPGPVEIPSFTSPKLSTTQAPVAQMASVFAEAGGAPAPAGYKNDRPSYKEHHEFYMGTTGNTPNRFDRPAPVSNVCPEGYGFPNQGQPFHTQAFGTRPTDQSRVPMQNRAGTGINFSSSHGRVALGQYGAASVMNGPLSVSHSQNRGHEHQPNLSSFVPSIQNDPIVRASMANQQHAATMGNFGYSPPHPSHTGFYTPAGGQNRQTSGSSIGFQDQNLSGGGGRSTPNSTDSKSVATASASDGTPSKGPGGRRQQLYRNSSEHESPAVARLRRTMLDKILASDQKQAERTRGLEEAHGQALAELEQKLNAVEEQLAELQDFRDRMEKY